MSALPGYLISIAIEAECEELAALINSAYRGETSRRGWTTEAEYLDGQRTDPVTLRSVIQKPEMTLYCLREAAGQPILAAVQVELLNSGSDLYFGMLTVRPDMQAKGLGRALLDHVESAARAQNCSRVVMGVIHIRVSLIAWYQRRGYQLTGETRPFPYGKSEFGIPRRDDLHFVMFEKPIPSR
jgi:ribosomal protein S18 acetylase RimI-like enzyme